MLKKTMFISFLLVGFISKPSVNIQEQQSINVNPISFTVWFDSVGHLYVFQQAAENTENFPGQFAECAANEHGERFYMKFSLTRPVSIQDIQRIVTTLRINYNIDGFISLEFN
ncbi:MAG: hypothetical protein P4L22_06030 [Candidatus Babeliales bacterium]|nr:hypothetical protein [Candidatus Babeliales bacterium]